MASMPVKHQYGPKEIIDSSASLDVNDLDIHKQQMTEKKTGRLPRGQFKRFAFWQSFLRLFRRFLKKDAISLDALIVIRTKPIEQRANFYTQFLRVPAELANNERTPRILIILIESHKIVIKKKLSPESRAYLGVHARTLLPQFHQIFMDNSENQRLLFFRDPLIHHLWNIFSRIKAKECREIINRPLDEQWPEANVRHLELIQETTRMQDLTGC